MIPEVQRLCRSEGLISPGDHVVCAVSGGADSMALLWCLYSLRQELGITLTAAHFNHLLRKDASEGDEAFVREFCRLHGIDFSAGRGDVAAFAAQKGLSLEEAARTLRYGWLKSLPHDRLATAHHAGDNAETVLLHLLRGSGLRGLCGIAPRSEDLIRPLLTVTRDDILSYLHEQHIPWREDETNGEDFCRRNRLRHHVLPLLLQEEPKLLQKLGAQSSLLRQEDAFLDALALELLCKAETDGGYDCQTLLSANDVLQKRALRLMLRRELPQDVSLRHIEAMQQLLAAPSPSGELSLPGGVVVRRCYGAIAVSRQSGVSFPPTPLSVPGQTEIPALSLCINCQIAADADLCGEKTEKAKKNANTPFHFAIKYDMISQSILWVRPRQTGDRMIMADGHSKSLKKLFIERKLPRHLRQSVPVIVAGGEVIAVGGVGVSKPYAAVAGQAALMIDIEKKET